MCFNKLDIFVSIDQCSNNVTGFFRINSCIDLKCTAELTFTVVYNLCAQKCLISKNATRPKFVISKKTLGLLTGLRLVPVVGPICIQIVMNVKFT